MADSWEQKLWSALSNLIEKQNYATKQFYQMYDKLATQQQNTLQASQKADDINQGKPKQQHELKNQFSNLPISKSIKVANEQNHKDQQKSQNSMNVMTQDKNVLKKPLEQRKSPILGFHFMQMHEGTDQNQIPQPKLRQPKQNRAIMGDNKDTKQNLNKILERKQQSLYSIIPLISTSQLKNQVIASISPNQQAQSQSIRSQIYKNQKLANARLKNYYNSNQIPKKSAQTQVNQSNLNEVFGMDSSMDLEVNSRQQRFCKFYKKYPQNIQINSNVVSYCQSRITSNFDMFQANVSQDNLQKNLGKNHKQLKKAQMRSSELKKVNVGSKRSKLSINRIRTDLSPEEQLTNQELARSQLKVVYEKKYILQQKLKKLNRQLMKLSAEKQKKMEKSLYDHPNSSVPAVDLLNPQAGQCSPCRSRRSDIYKKMSSFDSKQRKSYKNHLNQLQSSKRAIQFIQKISKQSLRRKLMYQKNIKANIFQKVKDHACINCSRQKCLTEAFQGEARKYNFQIQLKKTFRK